MLDDLLKAKKRVDPGTLESIRMKVREVIDLPDDALITVSQLECSEPDCPDLETVIVISPRPGDSRQIKFFKPAADVGLKDIQVAIDRDGDDK
jgi:hypothetical protein